MKKSIFAAILFCATALVPCVAVTKKSNTNNISKSENVVKADPKDSFAKIKFDTLRANLGTFPASDPIRKVVFKFTNTGTAPLVIHQAMASCGCTTPKYPTTPIKAGESGKIEVEYNGRGKFPGHFQKTITVRSNATTELVRLTIEGDMTE